MKAGHHLHPGKVRADLTSKSEDESFTAARNLLRQHLIHKREIPNGRDFLFSGPEADLHDALRSLVEIAHKWNPHLHFDYARVDEYFLLRITGSEEYWDAIQGYFDHDEGEH